MSNSVVVARNAVFIAGVCIAIQPFITHNPRRGTNHYPHDPLVRLLGKGVWDGLLGMIKSWLRKRILEAVVDPSMAKKLTDSGNIASAFDCYEMLTGHFASDEYGESKEADNKSKIKQWTVFWVGPDEIERPKKTEVFESLEGIKSSYQFYALSRGKYAVRSHGDWCLPCVALALEGPSGAFIADLIVDGCPYQELDADFCEFKNKSCELLASGAVQERRAALRLAGANLAKAVQVSSIFTWVDTVCERVGIHWSCTHTNQLLCVCALCACYHSRDGMW